MGWLLSLLGGLPAIFTSVTGSINTVSNNLSNEKIALINATTDREKVEINERISTLQAQKDLLLAESMKSKLPLYMQIFGASGPFMYVFTIFAWDKVMGKFAGCVGHTAPDQIGTLFWVDMSCKIFETDPLDANQIYLMLMVFGFFFVHTTVGLFKK